MKTKTPTPNPRANRDVAQRIARYLEDNYRETYDIKIICRKAGYSQTHCHRLFRAEYKLSPRQYLGRVRLAHAEAFLRTTDITITRIAEACGYESESGFRRAFGNEIRCSPIEFRNRLTRKTR